MNLLVAKNKVALLKIAARAKAVRKAAGLDQKTVAQSTGVNVGCIEAGQTNFTIRVFEKLCKYYGLTLAEFFKELDL